MTSAADSTRTPTPHKRGLLRAIFSDTWVRHGIGGTVSAVAMGAVWAVLPWADEPHWAGALAGGAAVGASLYMVGAALFPLILEDLIPGVQARWAEIKASAKEDV